jgi:hypothetical protein
MTNKTSKTETKRLPKGQRTHTRRLKQAARKEIGANTPHSGTVQPERVHKVKDQS